MATLRPPSVEGMNAFWNHTGSVHILISLETESETSQRHLDTWLSLNGPIIEFYLQSQKLVRSAL